MGETLDTLRLIGPAGSNRVMIGELSRLAKRAGLGARVQAARKQGPASVVYPFDAELATLAVRYHRTCSRVLWDLWQSPAQRLEPLYEDLVELIRTDRRSFLTSDFTISVQAHGLQEFAAGERQVVGTVKNAIVDALAARSVQVGVSPQDPDVHVQVGLSQGAVIVSLDLAGRPMNQRGYRQGTGGAPLRENLAAMLVMLARHDPRGEPLVDPLAGTGTIAIEAAGLAQGTTLWRAPRAPACARLPEFAPHFEQPPGPLFGDTQVRILANEADPRVHRLCTQQVERAGVAEKITCTKGDFRSLDVRDLKALATNTGSGLILSNPPYGVRLDEPQLQELYTDLGHFCGQLRGWRAGFLVANPDFEPAFGRHSRLRPRIKKPLSNGPLRGYFLLYEL